MRIRLVRRGDGGELCHVFVRSAHGLGATAYSPEQLQAWTSRITPSRLEERLLATVSFVAEEDGRLVGFASLDPDAAELDFLYVHPSFAARGIGRALSDTVDREAALRGVLELRLTASLNAVPVYERLGYVREGVFEKTLDGVHIQCLRMRKTLPRERMVHGVRVLGLAVGPRTECAHYHSELDIIAIRFPCCGEFYPCFHCHAAVADHPVERWPADRFDTQGILCGACGAQLSISAYLNCGSRCPACGSGFNPGCATHRHLYFGTSNET